MGQGASKEGGRARMVLGIVAQMKSGTYPMRKMTLPSKNMQLLLG
jgi:hypothetical protein